ncbi:hypothetical protein P0D88_31335 [Paraburkholderia sp. RL18-103-BIB-C]|uniref:hypothetical protein n=1 Tax=Paraburkholderia sp. RL18-103-BIB-C TaxID=3031637 RepID=UPI0038BB6922
MLDFVKHPVKIAHINVRTEMHGDEEVTAVDVKLTFDLPNQSLDKLSSTLRPALYAPDGDGDLLGKDEQHMPHLRNPQLGILRWAGEYEPVSLHLHTGGKPKDDILLSGATFGKLSFRPQEGGTCSYTARVQILPNADEAAKLMMLLKHEVPATLDADEAVNVEAGDDDE